MSGDRSTTLASLGDSSMSLFRNLGTAPRHLLPPDPDHAYQQGSDTSRSLLYDPPRLHDLDNDSETLYGSDTLHSSPRDAEAAVAQIEVLQDEKQGLSIWWLYASIAAVAFVYSLDQNVTGNYLPIATSAYDRHSILGTINTAESIINAVAKPFIAKIADVTSRPNAYSVTLVFYVLGYLLIAGSTVVEEVVAGMLVYTVGHSGLNLVTELLVADLSSLKWRGLVLSLTSLPFLVNTFLGAEIVHAIVESGNWRWGYGMFTIILPAVMLPAIFVLRTKRLFSVSNAQRRRWKQRQHDLNSRSNLLQPTVLDFEEPSYFELVRDFMIKMDFGGLTLIAVSFALLLLPFTLAKSTSKTLSSGLLIIEITGVVLFSIFVFYERFIASYPLMPSRILVNRAFLSIVMVDFWYFMSGSLRSNYLSSYVYVVKDWSTREWSYFNNSTIFTLCVFGPIAGLILRYTHRYKTLQTTGLVIRVLAMALMLRASHATGSSFELISTQILLGVGGAFNVVGSRVAAQASVPHQDLASVIALLSLWTQLGGSVGSAMATRMWASTMPANLARNLPDLSPEEIVKLYGSVSEIHSYPYDHPIRQGAIRAYEETAGPLWLFALITSVLPVIAALFLPNYYLGDAHNAVEGNQPYPHSPQVPTVVGAGSRGEWMPLSTEDPLDPNVEPNADHHRDSQVQDDTG